ncbi:MAG: tRNA threonylcarbamoyladenosine dehydratase [Clostridiales bacterium]|nr:tRNA threonylcarbamoyladenosine dehydratase [Clostridiales bacterium]
MTGYLYEDIFARNILLWGVEAQERLRGSHILLAGLGGVGSYIAEALARSGAGALTLIDHDRVEISNMNRQLPAILPDLGRYKVRAAGERVVAINPACRLRLLEEFITADNAHMLGEADYYIDAIDYVPGKAAIISYALALGKPVASAMGAGRRVAPERLRLADISQTAGCPLARELRRRLRALGIEKGVTVVYSEEAPRENMAPAAAAGEGGKTPLGSCAFVAAVAGLLLASAVIRDLAGLER